MFLFLFLFPVSSQVPALESVEQGGVSNHTEAAIIHKLLSLLIKVLYIRKRCLSVSVSEHVLHSLCSRFLFFFFRLDVGLVT